MHTKLDFESAVHQQINQLISAVDTFKGSWKVLEQTKSSYLKELRKIATIESIGSSTRIEGSTLTNAEVEKLLRSVKISKLEKRDEQEVVGYYEALEIILENYEEIPLTQSYIHQLHGILLKHSDKDQTHKGRFKNLSNQVVANYLDGAQRIIFRTTEPHLTASEMEALLLWTNERLEMQDLHPLLIVCTFVYEFLSIHPYQDGNGRLSRLLTTLLLLKLDYQFVQYVSFEHVIEQKKEAYYSALMEGQKNRYKAKERIDKWVRFFLESLISLTQRLEVKYDIYSKLKVGLNDRQQQIVAFVKENETAQIREIEASLEDYSRNTIKKDLAYLVNEGILLKKGAGRGVRYYLKSKLEK
ncbi:MAG: Fic family protein [Bacteroidota bacterium]